MKTMVSVTSLSSSSTRPPKPNFATSFTPRIFSDIAGDITVVVNGESFLLHKFPLVSRSGKIRKLVQYAKAANGSKIELQNMPGGSETFELAMKFCYGMDLEIKPTNVAHLRCAAEYLEMTEDYREENLASQTENYTNNVVVQCVEKSVQVLVSCEELHPTAEQLGIPSRCIEAIALNVCKEQLVSGLSRLDGPHQSRELDDSAVEWWIKHLLVLKIDLYERVIRAMQRIGVRADSIVASLMHYAQKSLKGIGISQFRYSERTKSTSSAQGCQSTIMETLVSLMPSEKSSNIPLSFLFGILRMAIVMDAKMATRLELERRIALRMETVTLHDLLIPSVRTGDSMFDVDTIHRIVVNFLQQMEKEEEEEEDEEEEERAKDFGYESDDQVSASHCLLLKVGRLMDAFLAEIGPDPYMSVQKFTSMIELLPDYARVSDDGLYRAVDIYLKAHPTLPEQDCRRLCKLIDCQKLSQEASNHAAQNDRLPVQMTVRVLYFEQVRLKSALSGNIGDGYLSQRMNSGVQSAAMSPRDTYASLRRENRELKLEISRMRVRLSELEKEQLFMKQGMMDKSPNGTTFLTSLSRGIGKIGIFSSPVQRKQQKPGRKSRGSDGKMGRNRAVK